MEISTHEQNGVLIRRFSGSVNYKDIINAWNLLFKTYDNLENYKGIVHNYQDAEFEHKELNLNELIDYLREHMDQLKDLRIGVVMDTPLVTHTIIMSAKISPMQIRPFSTTEAALSWILH
jgi:hypothetical protein